VQNIFKYTLKIKRLRPRGFQPQTPTSARALDHVMVQASACAYNLTKRI